MNNATLIQEVADRQAITDLLYRYCRAMDRIDHELGYSIWHDDGEADYGENVFQGSGRGFIDHVCEQHSHLINHSHQVTNVVIELNGDKAASEAYVTANLRMERGGKLMQIQVLSRYLDQWSRRDGRWGIDKRKTLMDMGDIREVNPMASDDRWSRDRNDPSYEVFAAIRS